MQSAVGLQLKQEEPALVEVEGVLNDDTGDEEVDAASRRRISALVHVASTAEAELLEHDEMAKAAWSHAPDGVKRPRALEDYDQAAHKRPRPEQGVAGGLTGSEPSAAEQQALMQKWMIEHAFVLQKMAQVVASQNVCGLSCLHRTYGPTIFWHTFGTALQNCGYDYLACSFRIPGIVTEFDWAGIRAGSAGSRRKQTRRGQRVDGQGLESKRQAAHASLWTFANFNRAGRYCTYASAENGRLLGQASTRNCGRWQIGSGLRG
jgi:hypothetical protein